MDDLISRQAAIEALAKFVPYAICDESTESYTNGLTDAYNLILQLPPARPEQPPYVAEIEAEYQKAVKMPHIHKPLAKALYEVWKKHDREDAERREE